MKKLIALLCILIPILGNSQCDSFDGTLSVSATGFTTGTDYTQEYVIVDNLGVILDINSTGNFTGLPDGNYTIYAVNYEGATPIALGIGLPWNAVNTFDLDPLNCFHSISNTYTVCSNTQLCDGDDIIVSTSNFYVSAGFQQVYVLVDLLTGNIMDANNTGVFNQASYVGLGNYEVYAVNTDDAALITLLNGNGSWNAVLTAISTSCADMIGPKNFNVVNCCDLLITATPTDETCAGNDGSIELVITGTTTYDVLINGVPYAPLNDVTADTYTIPNLSDGTYEIIVFDILDNTCDDTLDLAVLDGGTTYNLVANINACLNSLVNYPDGTNEIILANTSHTSNLLTIQGCDSIIVTNVTVTPNITNTVNEIVCFGTQFTSPQGNNYSVGSFDETYLSASGCDSTVTFVVTELPAITNTVNESVCFGTQFTSPQGNNYSVGSFDETYLSAFGCDSTVTFVVTELPAITNTVNESVCFGTQFTSPQGNNYSVGSFDETYLSDSGCDSTVTFVVTEQPAITNTVNESICFGTQFTSPQGNNYSVGSFDETYLSDSGCDSTVTFVVTEQPAITNTVNESICFGTQFTSPQGNNYSAGSFDETYVSASGCDSTVTFVVTEQPAITNTVNESICFGTQFTSPQGNNYSVGSFDETYLSDSGCDSTVTFVVTEQPAITNTVNESICFGTQFTSPQGNNYSVGSFDETYLSASGCDSTVTFVVTEQPAITNTVNESICFGTQFTSPQGNNYSAGSFDETYVSASGCDSIVTFVVTEVIAITNTINESVCLGAQFTSPQGNNYGIGSFDETYTSIAGCDSIVTFIVAELPPITNTINESICFGTQFTSPQGNNYNAGSFDEIFTASSGCDSTVTFVITELPLIVKAEFETICFGTQFTSPQGNNYGNGAFDETYTSISGCDSIVTFNITELPAITNTINEVICFGAQFTSPQGNNYNAGSFDETYASTAGCDSVVTFIISDLPSITSVLNETICFGTLFTSPQGNDYSAGSFDETYTSTFGCDSVVTFNITESIAISNTVNESVCFGSQFTSPQGNIYGVGTFDETYASASGCDSIVTFVISELAAITSTIFENVCYGDQYTTNEGVVLVPGTYTEVFTSSSGCDSVVTLIISEYNQVIADFFFNSYDLTSLNSEAQFGNTSSGATSYLWDFGDQSLNSTEESPIHQYELFEAGNYNVTLIAFNEFGCSDTTVQAALVQEELIYYIPNTFTPDGDEFNQTFKPVFSSGFDPFDYTLLIFNRWGQLIFESHDVNIGWDGTYKGQYSQDGAYTWKVEFKELSSDKRQFQVGHVNMLR